MTERKNFLIQVGKRVGNVYPITFNPAIPTDVHEKELEINFDEIEENYLSKIRKNLTSDQFFLEFGKLLFERLFPGESKHAFSTNRAFVVGQQHDVLQVSLRISRDASELDELPWEYLFLDPLWFAAGPKTPFHRYIDSSFVRSPLSITPPIKILLAIANPKDQSGINFEDEVEQISNATNELKEWNLINIEKLNPTSRQSLFEKLNDYNPHILHFIGHGAIIGNVAGLYLQGDKNKDHSDFVQDKLFVDLLLNNDSVRLVVFNACHSYKIALLLAKQGLSAIGMRHEILDKAAYWFSYRFYRELANGQPVDVAVNSARFAIRYYHSSDTRDWGSVILFLPQGNPDLFKVLSDKRLIQVSSNPDKAIIVVNTTKTDKITPGTLYAKLNEPYHITVQKEGYKIPKSRKITITSNEPISIDFALERESGNLDVQTKPAESGIEIQFFEQTIKKYKKLGVTDTNGYFQLSMPTGIYNFKAKMFSAKDKIIKEIEKHNEKIESDKTTTILFNFETETKYRFLTNFNRTKMLLISTVATLIFIISFFLIGFLNTYKVPEGMVRIPAGNFVKGGEDTPLLNILRKYKDDIKDLTPLIEDAPSKGYIERGFFIDKYEVTNLQYRRFIRATNRRPPKHWENGQIPAGEENYPVVNVTWYDARAYAKWAGKRLLTDDEWERAARGTDGRLFPWGNEFDENKCNSYESPTEGLVDVYEYDNGKSLEGAFNMVGNVYEWTKGKYIENGETVGYIIKGGGYLSSCELYGLAYYKIKAEPNYKSKTLGFRCALTSSQETNPPDNMVYIPSGEFIQGSEDNYTLNLVRELNLSGSSLALLIDSKPESVFVKEYFIDKYEVTNKQYRQFLDAVGDDRKWSHPDEPKEKTSQTPEGWKDENLSHEDQPVVGIDWFDAYAYAKWAGKRLPTDNEWEKAARGDDGRYYPWGNEFDIKKFRGGKEDKEETISVYQFSPNNCSYMISAMAGNACEWVNGYKDNERVVRGGAWNDSYLKVHALTFVRLGAPAEYRKVDVGFRCAKDRRFSFIEKILGKNKLR